MQALAREPTCRRPPSSFPVSPRSNGTAAFRSASSPPRRSCSSPATPRLARRAGSISTTPHSRRGADHARSARWPHSCRFTPQTGGHGVFGTMRQNDPTFGEVHDRAALRGALGPLDRRSRPEHSSQTVSTGMAFCIVPLSSLEVAARLGFLSICAAYLERSDAKFFHCITRAEAGSGADWHARMQFYNGEDPATGSASGCTISYLVRHGLAASRQPIVIEQGIEMLRPSRIHVSAHTRRDGHDMFQKCSSEGAPFLLQWDAFSCRDALDIHRHT